jgi:hypothetical protein
MTLIVQDDRATVEGANSYVDLDVLKAYHTTRGVDLSSYPDERLSQALVLATDFLDSRYSFVGVPLRAKQGTQCPRYLEERGGSRFPQDYNTLEPGYLLTTMQWSAIQRATCQLAYRELKKPGGLMPDPTFDATGQRIKKKTSKAGPVESTVEYADSPDGLIPSYPAVDLLLRSAGLLNSRNSGSVGRG